MAIKIQSNGELKTVAGSLTPAPNHDDLSGKYVGIQHDAANIGYNNTASHLTSSNTQDVVDELKGLIDSTIPAVPDTTNIYVLQSIAGVLTWVAI